MALPNLERIPGIADAEATKALERVPEVIDAQFLRTVDRQTQIALGRYGVRAVTTALRSRDPLLLRPALLATAIALGDGDEDPRDTMVKMALHHVCARQLDVEPKPVFDDVAARFANGGLADLLREFGSRSDITLDGFGWRLVSTTDGVDFEPL